jgi:predicted nucleic acid-binding protein
VTCCVLDSSVALAWVLPGEGTDATEALLDEIAAAGATAPGLWPLETANVLLYVEKARRITPDERRRSLTMLAALPIHIDPDTAAQAWNRSLTLAEAQGLTLYDASYLELALRRALPLASLDKKLREAAAACGVKLLGQAVSTI